MVNWRNFFLVIGVPILAFYTFLIIIYFAFISGLFLWVLIIGCCCLRKKDIWAGLSKLTLALLMFIFIFFPNLTVFPAQIANHIDTSRIITPNDPLVQQLNETDYMWDYLNGLNIPATLRKTIKIPLYLMIGYSFVWHVLDSIRFGRPPYLLDFMRNQTVWKKLSYLDSLNYAELFPHLMLVPLTFLLLLALFLSLLSRIDGRNAG